MRGTAASVEQRRRNDAPGVELVEHGSAHDETLRFSDAGVSHLQLGGPNVIPRVACLRYASRIQREEFVYRSPDARFSGTKCIGGEKRTAGTRYIGEKRIAHAAAGSPKRIAVL